MTRSHWWSTLIPWNEEATMEDDADPYRVKRPARPPTADDFYEDLRETDPFRRFRIWRPTGRPMPIRRDTAERTNRSDPTR
jgi:hypothetical protein